MVENKSLKETAAELMKIKGNVRGAVFETFGIYIKNRKGEAGLRKVEEKIKELGYDLNFGDISPMKMYPDALESIVLLTVKEIFNWTDDDITEIGKTTPKYSFIVKLFVRYFISPQKGYEAVPKYWDKHFDFGKLEAPEYNEKEKYCVIKLKEFKIHPIFCVFFTGYIETFAGMIVRGENLRAKEVKCAHRGDPYHEWIIKWD